MFAELLLMLSVCAAESPEQSFVAAMEARERLTPGEALYRERIRQPRPLPTIIAEGVFGLGTCGFMYRPWRAQFIRDGEGYVTINGERCIVLSPHIKITVTDPAEPQKRERIIAAAAVRSEDGKIIFEEIDPTSPDLAICLKADEWARRRMSLAGVGECYFRDLKGGLRVWMPDGTERKIDSRTLTKANNNWIRDFHLMQNDFKEARAIDSEPDDWKRIEKYDAFLKSRAPK